VLSSFSPSIENVKEYIPLSLCEKYSETGIEIELSMPGRKSVISKSIVVLTSFPLSKECPEIYRFVK
jgi:hypothetical protein